MLNFFDELEEVARKEGKSFGVPYAKADVRLILYIIITNIIYILCILNFFLIGGIINIVCI